MAHENMSKNCHNSLFNTWLNHCKLY
jgi:hypothetical protein